MNRAAAICMIIGSSIWLILAFYDTFSYFSHLADLISHPYALYWIGSILIPICFLIASIFLLINKK